MEASEYLKNYNVYSDGTVRNHKTGRELKQDTSTGYARVVLSNNGNKNKFSVHRLVAMVFLKNKDNKPCVNHKDGNKLNNHYTNLEWCTYSENEQHSFKVLGKTRKHSEETKKKIGESNKGNIMSEEQKKQISVNMKGRTPWNKGIKQKDYVKK